MPGRLLPRRVHAPLLPAPKPSLLRNPPCLKQQREECLDGAVRQYKLLQRVQALPDGQLQLSEVLGQLQFALRPERANLRGMGEGELRLDAIGTKWEKGAIQHQS